MSDLMDYGYEPAEAARDVQPGFPPMTLGKRCIAYAIIPAVAIWLIGEALLYARGHIELTRPGAVGVQAPASRSAWRRAPGTVRTLAVLIKVT